MSYNFEQCLQSIQEHRRKAYASFNAADATSTSTSSPDLEALQQSMDGFATLSKHCPMAPLLWMQYAHDTGILMEELMMLEGAKDDAQQMLAKQGALETSTGILELALAEFPGCALLHLYYLECCADRIYQCEGLRRAGVLDGEEMKATHDKFVHVFDTAYQSVGRGTHVNEGMLVSEIYRLYGSFLMFSIASAATDMKKALAESGGVDSITNLMSRDKIAGSMTLLVSLFEKWSKTPMGEGANDEMMLDMEYFWDEACTLLVSLCDGEDEKRQKKQDLEQQKATLWASIDNERKNTSSLTNVLSSYENGVDVAMSAEGIAMPHQSLFPQQQDDEMADSNSGDSLSRYVKPLKRVSSKWNKVLLDDTNRFLIGLGGSETSRAFSKSTAFLQRAYQGVQKKGNKADRADRSPLQDHIATHQYSLIGSLYERALSECPTVESLWVSYINFLRGEWTLIQGETTRHLESTSILSLLKSTSQRAIRNCPYSSTLFEIRMTTLGLISVSNLEPDDIIAVVKEATELGFLNHNREAMLHLRLVAILVVKRKLLSLVSLGTAASQSNGIGKDYDQIEAAIIYKKIDSAVAEEVKDLIEDIRDMYEETDSFLFKSHSTWYEGKVSFWRHRALSEAYVLCPISLAMSGDLMSDEMNGVSDKEARNCFEKLVKTQKPAHPDSWREYIRYLSSSMHLQPNEIAASASTLRKTRGLYQRSMSSVKKAGQDTTAPAATENKQAWMGRSMDGAMFHRQYDVSLADLCQEYLDFERNNGSEESFSHAQTVVRSKLANYWNPVDETAAAMSVATNGHEESYGKRKLDTDNVASTTQNEASMMTTEENEVEVDAQSRTKRVKVKTDLKQPKKTDGLHKVCVGKMEYPAHPYTLHVSKLSKETNDMELVDAFRAEFGAVVHAKILREKHFGRGGHHHHGESKCAGLIQFEERLSVEQALQKDGEFEVGGKVVKIQRSHLPAVGLVPAGMHRVNPKGEGKASNRNKFKKGSKMKVDTTEGVDTKNGGKGSANIGGYKGKKDNSVALPSPSNISLSVLSFKPRGMRQKPKITLDSNKKK